MFSSRASRPVQSQRPTSHRPVSRQPSSRRTDSRPPATYRQRLRRSATVVDDYGAPEKWYPVLDSARNTRFVVQPPGAGYVHPVSIDDIRARLDDLPARFRELVHVLQLSSMTRKRRSFPLYGMQWGSAVYLYPMEDSLIERYVRPPQPQQLIESKMFGGTWSYDGEIWRLTWTEAGIRDFYLNNVLIHEIGHLVDTRNTNTRDRERFANWFAIEYGYRPTRRRN